LNNLRGYLKRNWKEAMVMENISSLVPRSDAEIAILKELEMVGGDADTGYIVNRAMEHFPILQTPEEKSREVPTGQLW